MYQSTTTSERLRQPSCERTESKKSILSAAASPVKMCHAPALEKALRTAMGKLLDPDYGENTHALLTSLDHDGSWLKMSEGCCQQVLISDREETSELFSGTWPTWGMMRAGRVTALKPLVRRTKEKESLSWPTPLSGKWKDSGNIERLAEYADTKQRNLTRLVAKITVQNWPTPVVSDGAQCKKTNKHAVNLIDQVKHECNWPTPTKSDYKGAGPTNIRKDGKNRANDRLDYAVYSPQGQLNADWVEILMGLPIGWTDIDCEEPQPWPGWPAPMNAGENWITPQANASTQGMEGLLAREKRNGMHATRNLTAQIEVSQSGQYPYEPPRVVVGQKNRAKRLKCLGNGCCPAQIYPIFKAIMGIERVSR